MNRTTVIKALAAVIVVITLLLTLMACGNTVRSGNKTTGDCNDDGGSNCVTTIIYKGKPLNCITWQGYGTEVGLNCDFVEYHMNNGTGGIN